MATISGSRMAANASDLAKPSAGSSHPYTCNTCQVAFRNSDLQKSHMRTDWHRYNLKRRVASLPPISSEIFTEKVLQARAASTAEADKAGFERACDVCQKTYFSENQYRNHVGSAKHKNRVAAAMTKGHGEIGDDASSMVTSTFSLGTAGAEPVVDSDAEEEFADVIEGFKNAQLQERPSPVKRPSNSQVSSIDQEAADQVARPSTEDKPSTSATPTTEASSSAKTETTLPSLKSCLFCNYDSPTVPLSVVHMQRIHGMFIPEKDYLVDLEGLLSHLQRRIQELCECIFCGKGKANAFAVQTHMRDSGHCKIPYTTEEEQLDIGDFYDFRSTYSDGEEDEDESMDKQASGGAKLGAPRQTRIAREGSNGAEEEDGGWETDSSESSLDSNDLHGVPAERHDHQYERLQQHPHHSREDQRAHHQRDGWHAHKHKPAHAVFYDDFELHLPSGKSVGHRSLNRYFRQNLTNYPSAEEREAQLAIEAAEAGNEMDVDDEDGGKTVALRDAKAHGRSVVNRENRGLGIADPRTRQANKIITKGRAQEFGGSQRREIGASKRLFKEYHRNHATFM